MKKKTLEQRILELDDVEDAIHAQSILKQGTLMVNAAFGTLGADDGIIAFALALSIFQMKVAILNGKMCFDAGRIGEAAMEFVLDAVEQRKRGDRKQKGRGTD